MNCGVGRIKFTKMHGAGNDYIYIDGTDEIPRHLEYLARCISNRHYGIGSDGMVVIMRSEIADFKMRMFNADGSEAQMCGNASRCIGKFVFERGLTKKREITLETLAGIKSLRLNIEEDSVKGVMVDMGIPSTNAETIPLNYNKVQMIDELITVGSTAYHATAVSIGNPHVVIFKDEITDVDVLENGPLLETHPWFPQRTNIEFARIINPNEIEMRVWERGSGETLACGTGACATLVAANINGLASEEAVIRLKGGTLKVEWDKRSGHLFLTGGAEFIADGIFYYDTSNTVM